jgi:hypothetical protein
MYKGIAYEQKNNFDSAISLLKKLTPQIDDKSRLHSDWNLLFFFSLIALKLFYMYI